MPRVKAVRSFVWNLRDVDVGDILDVPAPEAFQLVHAYEYCVPVDGLPPPPTSMTITNADPVPKHADPPIKKRRR